MKIELRDKHEIQKLLIVGSFRFAAEFYLVQSRELPASLKTCPAYARFKRPTGWRLKTWRKILKGPFRELAAFQPGIDVFSCGVVMGYFQRMVEALESTSEEDDQFVRDSLDLVPNFQIDEQRAQENLDAMLALLDPDKFRSLVANERPEEMSDFFKGLAKGSSLLARVDKRGQVRWFKPTDATVIHLHLLIFGDYFEKQKSVKHVYELLREGLSQNEMPHSLEAFTRICNRVGFTGASYRRRKKRINSQQTKR